MSTRLERGNVRRPLGTVSFVLGTAYSGSTLLSFLLDSLPDVACVGELVDVQDRIPDKAGYQCSCGQGVKECPFWNAVSEVMRSDGIVFGADQWRLHFRVASSWVGQRLSVRPLQNWHADAVRDAIVRHSPVWGPALREIAVRNRACMSAILQVTGKSIIVDASKDPRRVVLMRELADVVDPAVIHLVRDSPGYVWSDMKHLGMSLKSSALTWNRMAKHIERLRRHVHPDRWLFLRYEDLCLDPNMALDQIAEFLGSRPVPARSTRLDRTAHHVRGNDMRLGGIEEVRLDTAWRDRLSRSQIVEICEITARHRERLGYPPVAVLFD